MSIASPRKHLLPYFTDSTQLFSSIAAKPWSVFLDSGFPYNSHGRYDIISTNPVKTLVAYGNISKITHNGKVSYSYADPFSLIKQQLKSNFYQIAGIPFNGGAIGYFAYDLTRRLAKLPVITKDTENIAQIMLGIYPWAVIVDHHKKQSWLVGRETEQNTWSSLIEQFSVLDDKTDTNSFAILAKPLSNMDQQSYKLAFTKIKSYLRAGDIYQVNLAQRFSSPCTGSAWVAYKLLRQINSAPFSAYLNYTTLQVLSSSPERFIKVTGKEVETKPIKGTRPKLLTKTANAKQIQNLIDSPKDRAENLMIVDLLRNDISKNCRLGSVKVDKLFDVESFATVHHLVSTVKGILNEGQCAVDLLKNCFPGGSITGAPKIRAMQIIEEIEPNSRGVYCGSIGYLSFNGNMDINIAIRTLIHSENTIRFWTGGGIVIDSIMEDEYQESFDKAYALLNLLEQFYVHKSN